ncbi:uncharacterized protein LOC106171248 [Lingula anatina]|uniref:Uncharacterized protein LOC106171248 n=1 Tax=Lingula anatina TaxID=7574 RepID=A0A1S3J993_LINAN|nr:uncharacterized protein LOC106171248 [Lingula anatina]|eukprot:XP_013406970.1 uncharacterized protein LOC106171248 [Lingula anatina]
MCTPFADKKKRLKPGAIPSIFPFNNSQSIRSDEVEDESQANEAVAEKHEDCAGESQKESTASQCDITTPSYTRESIMLYQKNAKAVQYQTRFSHIEHFMLFFNGPPWASSSPLEF